MGERKKYDLEERTFVFAKNVRKFVNKLPRAVIYNNDVTQLLRSSGSIGANYIEANESLGKKDFAMRIKICRKEAKETVFWLRLLTEQKEIVFNENERRILENEATELTHIFGSIVTKVA